VVGNGAKGQARDADREQAELFEQIGRLKMELEWVKKKAAAFGCGRLASAEGGSVSCSG